MDERIQGSKTGVCLYEEVAHKIQADIIRSNLKSGDKLGTELELAARYGVSRATIRHALVSLENAGLIDRFHGRGTFVADKSQDGQWRRQYSDHRSLFDHQLYRAHCDGCPRGAV